MKRRRHTPEQAVRRLREGERQMCGLKEFSRPRTVRTEFDPQIVGQLRIEAWDRHRPILAHTTHNARAISRQSPMVSAQQSQQ